MCHRCYGNITDDDVVVVSLCSCISCWLSAPLIYVFVTRSVHVLIVDMHRLISAIIVKFRFLDVNSVGFLRIRRGVGERHPANFGHTPP